MKKKTSLVKEVRNEIVSYKLDDLFDRLKKEPSKTLLSIVSGAFVTFSNNKAEIALSGTRFIKSFIDEQFKNQFLNELNTLREKGKIEEEFLSDDISQSEFYQILVELENNMPDKEKLIAMKHLFYATIDKDTTDKFKAYTLFKRAKDLSSMEFVILKANYEYITEGKVHGLESIGHKSAWRTKIAEKIGFGQEMEATLLDSEKILEDKHLILSHGGQDQNNFAAGSDFRLTLLGKTLCEYIKKYESFVK